MKSRLLIVLFATAIVGCAPSLGELRSSAPTKTGDFSGTYVDMTVCLIDRLESDYRLTHIIRDRELSASLTHLWDSGYSRFAVFDISIQQTTSDTVFVELRQMGTVWGPETWNDRVWPIVESCGGA